MVMALCKGTEGLSKIMILKLKVFTAKAMYTVWQFCPKYYSSCVFGQDYWKSLSVLLKAVQVELLCLTYRLNFLEFVPVLDGTMYWWTLQPIIFTESSWQNNCEKNVSLQASTNADRKSISTFMGEDSTGLPESNSAVMVLHCTCQ